MHSCVSRMVLGFFLEELEVLRGFSSTLQTNFQALMTEFAALLLRHSSHVDGTSVTGE